MAAAQSYITRRRQRHSPRRSFSAVANITPRRRLGRPAGWVVYGEVSAVAVDSCDQVYVFSRSEHPLVVFDCEGRFVRSWGEGVFKRPHGLHIGPDDAVYCTDDGDHTVRKFTPEGKLLLTIGTSGVSSPFMCGHPFHRCTHTALSPSGEIYVTDGYGNARSQSIRRTAAI